jgi:hypothetical protein
MDPITFVVATTRSLQKNRRVKPHKLYTLENRQLSALLLLLSLKV